MSKQDYSPVTIAKTFNSNYDLLENNSHDRRWDESALSSRLNAYVHYPNDNIDDLKNSVDLIVNDRQKIQCNLNELSCKKYGNFDGAKPPNGNILTETFDNTVCACNVLKIIVLLISIFICCYLLKSVYEFPSKQPKSVFNN